MTPAGRGPWLAVRVEIPADLEDEAASALGGEGCLGVEALPGSRGGTVLRAYLPATVPASDLLARAEACLRSAGIDPAPGDVRVERIGDGRWAERYQASLRPLPLGKRFRVVPGIAAPEDGSRKTIVLVPGGAFGTGEHATTRLSAAALERWVRPGERWLDLGTGSGILAMVAAFSGARLVEAVDTDPEAVAVATAAMERNGLSRVVRVVRGSADSLHGAGFDGVVANLAAAYFEARSADVAAALRREGMALASGFLGEQAKAVADALSAVGLEVVEGSSEEDWALLAARRVGP